MTPTVPPSTDGTDEDLSALLVRLLQAKRMTQKHLADATGIPHSTINSWITRRRGGAGAIDAEKLRAVAEALGEPPRLFFAADRRPTPGPVDQEREAKLLRIYRALPTRSQRSLVEMAEALMNAARAS